MFIIYVLKFHGSFNSIFQVSELDSETVGLGIAVLALGLSIRILVSYLAVLGGNLTHRYPGVYQ